MFTQPFVRAQIIENIKAPRHWSLWGEFTGERYILNVAAAVQTMQAPTAPAAIVLIYRQTSNKSRIKSQNWNVSRFVLQLSLPNQLKPDATSRMKM